MYPATRCEDLWDALSAYADGEATPPEVARIEQHLPSCLHCASVLAFMRQTSDLLDETPLVAPPADLRERILTATVWKREPVKVRARRLPAWSWSARLSLAGAACGLALLALYALPALTRVAPHSLVARAPVPLRPVAMGAAALASRAGRVTEKIGRIAAGSGVASSSHQQEEASADRALEDVRSAPVRVAMREPARVTSSRRPVPLHTALAPARRLGPFLHPERAEPPSGPPAGATEPPAAATAPPDAVLARHDESNGLASPPPTVVAAAERPAHRVMLAARTSDSDASMTTISELRQALRAVKDSAGGEEAFADRHEVTVNLLQSRF